MPTPRIPYILTAVIIGIMIVVLAWPGRISYTISTYGQVLPAQEWVLLRDNNGMIASVLRDNRSGAVRSYTLSQLERGAAMSLGFAQLQPDAAIKAGDTVAWAVSTDMEYTMATLRGNLAVAEAALNAARAGEKLPLVEEAEQRLQYAKKELEEQEALHRRAEGLYRGQHISEEEYEVSRNRLEMLRINVSIAESQLGTVTTGERDETIHQRVKEIEAIKGEINALGRRMALSTYVSPIDGILRHSTAADTLSVVKDVNEVILRMPVRLRENVYVSDDAGVRVLLDNGAEDLTAHIISTGSDVQYINGHAVLVSTATMKTRGVDLPGGLLLPCEIECGDITLLAYLTRWIQGVME